jgi:pimeloyl-ACP methyl ester carboxylesterase
VSLLTALLVGLTALPLDLPTGQVVDDVRCVADASQGYALYLPREYTASRLWPVIFAFDPGGRGRTAVDRYQTAAADYGFIVVGSNNSRNGSLETGKIVAAMATDVFSRLAIDPKRIYLAGMSGGARVALGVALGSPHPIAGVIASSAGYPDEKFRKTLAFPLFMTAGTEDFNHIEMRRVDQALTTPHHLAIFEGGHTWLSSDLALEAVEWMQIQAVKSGLALKDDATIDRILSKRMRALSHLSGKDEWAALDSLVADFEGLRDVSAQAARKAQLDRDRAVRAALKKDRDEDDREESLFVEIRTIEARLPSAEQREDALSQLRQEWKSLFTKATAADDSPERRLARRVLSGLAAGPPTTDADYQKIINQYRLPRTPR